MILYAVILLAYDNLWIDYILSLSIYEMGLVSFGKAGFVQTLESPGIKMLRFPGLESPGILK